MELRAPASKGQTLVVLEPPLWLQASLRGATAVGKGSYAWVWKSNGGDATKLTLDPATAKLFQQLKAAPCPGLPRTYRTRQIRVDTPRSGRKTAWALEMEWLSPLEPRKAAQVLRCYRQARQSAPGDQDKAQYSRRLLAALKRQCRLHLPQEPQLIRALTRLEKFVRETGYHLDLVQPTNWMQDSRGRIVLSDPVVGESFEF